MIRSTLLAFSLLALAPAALAQEETKPGVVEEDLGDGFRAVSVNGGPPAIIDDEGGLILKKIYGEPAVVDKASGAILTLDDKGSPRVRFWGKGGYSDEGDIDEKALGRMKQFMARVKELGGAKGKGEGEGKGKATRGKKKRGKKKKAKDRVTLYLELLALSAEESKAIRASVAAIVEQQDVIARSTLDVTALEKAKVKTSDLPSAIRTLQASFRALRAGKPVDVLNVQLAAFRKARQGQDTELGKRRAVLREVLTVEQEAKLIATGLLD